MSDTPASDDPIRMRRARIARAATLAQRVGYAFYAVAIVMFFIGFFAGFTGGIVTTIVAFMIAGSALLAPAIITGYAVKAAEREDREAGR